MLRYVFSLLVSLTIACQTPLQAEQVERTPDKILQYNTIQGVLNQVVPMFESFKTGADAEKELMSLFPKKVDRATLHEELSHIKTFPRVIRLNRGLGFRQDGRLYTVTFTNVFTGQLLFNDKVAYTYQPNNPLKLQLETIVGKIKKSESRSAAISLLLPEADAWIIPVIMVVIALAGLAMTVYNSPEVQNYYNPKRVAKFCQEQAKPELDKKLSIEDKYANSIYCKDFNAFKKATEVTTLPSVEPVSEDPKKTAPIQQENNCRKAGENVQTTTLKNTKAKVEMKVTVTFDDKDPVKITVELPDGLIRDYKLKDKQLDTVEVRMNGEKEIYTRDPEKVATLSTAEKLDMAEKMKIYDKDMEMFKPILQDCDNQGKATAAVNADKPASTLATELLSAPVSGNTKQMATDKGVRK